jgi:hypothetical protein
VTNELYHHGILGQRWGVRRYQRKDGSLTSAGRKRYRVDPVNASPTNYSKTSEDKVLKKGQTVTRVSVGPDDKTYDNKKYVSILPEDQKTWERIIGEKYADDYLKTYNQTYATTKDLRIMGTKKQGEIFTNMLMNNSDFRNQFIVDQDQMARWGTRKGYDLTDSLSMNVAVQSKTGKAFVDKVRKLGYDGLFDADGTNVAKAPVIVLNPENNLSKQGKETPTWVTKKYEKELELHD